MPSAFSAAARQSAVFVHRWLGVVLCTIFLLWFLSGVGMMYWDFPRVSPDDRLAHGPALDASQILLSPAEAAGRAGVKSFARLRLNTFDGRPAYRFSAAGEEAIVYADTGEERADVSKEMLDRIASSWAGQPASAATAQLIEDTDQWTIQIRLGRVRPLWKYSWPDGQQVYVSQASGDVVQYTTTGSRWGAYVGAIPHWLYFTPLRKHGPLWSRVVIWLAGTGAVAALLGIAIGIWTYSPSKRYRQGGAPASIPYRGQKRWHTILGLIFGVGAVTWAFSGMLSMEPFPLQRASASDAAGGRPDAGQAILQALSGTGIQLDAFSSKHPRQAVAQLAPFGVKEVEFLSFAGEPAYLATMAPGDTRVVPLEGEPQAEFDRQRIVDLVTAAARAGGGADVSVIDQYDRYYLDRRRRLALPVILVRLNDADQTRFYIDPKSARVVGGYSSGSWMSRWLYHGLHSLDFPWLYDHRPAWDVVVITFMGGGTALCVTSLILAWRVLVGRFLGARNKTSET
jgi:hypothetical protein